MKKLVNSVFNHLRQSELRLAKSILRWKLQKEDLPLPDNAELDIAASHLLDEAREIARKEGRSFWTFLRRRQRSSSVQSPRKPRITKRRKNAARRGFLRFK